MAGQVKCEVTRARADIGDHFARFQAQCVDDFVRLLIGITFRILQRADVRFRIAVELVHLMIVVLDGVLDVPVRDGVDGAVGLVAGAVVRLVS